MVGLLAAILRPLIVFYSRQEIDMTLPNEYGHFKHLRCIVDGTEMFIQTPSDLRCQLAT